MSRNLVFLSLTLLLTGCIAQSDIQADYMSQESDCRSTAQSSADSGGKEDAAGAAYRIGASFSGCMNKAGWKVSVPKPPPGPPAAATTAAAPLQATTPPASVAAPAAIAAPSRPVAPAPGMQPSPAPAAAAPPLNTPRAASPAPSTTPNIPNVPGGYSTYQPARPEGVAEPEYGSGGGRNY